ncbi:MAG: 6-carboxytetrahydropterin synthase [Bacteroidales bacterium]|nr:6-carboxytetrahydropterin synthase [Bacteroidales bacterium]
MARIRVTKEFNFEMAHALWNYDGACKNIHGHSYKLFVTLSGEPNPDSNHPKFGMVLDFKDLKQLVKAPIVDFLDHSLVVYRKAEGKTLSEIRKMYEKVHVVDFQPTCENLVSYIVDTIQSLLTNDIELTSVKLYETATSFAEWYAEDNK